MVNKISKLALIVALSAFVGAVLVDPGDHVLHLKLPLLILSLGLWAVRVIFGITKPGSPKIWALVLLFALIVPGTATIVGLLGSSLPPGGPTFQMMKEFTVLLLIPVLSSERIDLSRHIIAWSFGVAIITFLLVLLSLVAPLAFSIARDFAVENDNALISSRSLLGLGFGGVYYKTVGVLIFPIAFYLKNFLDRPKKALSFFFTCMFIFALVCSDNRAATVGLFFLIEAVIFRKIRAKFGLVAALSVLIIMIALPAVYLAGFFRPGESSNEVKLGHIRSYASEFEQHPTYLLWGQGADTQFYSQGFESKTALTELTYLDMIRWFGIPVAFLLLISAFYPVVGLMRRADSVSYLAIPYFAYLCESASDPLLICSTGLMIVSAMWSLTLINGVKHAATSRAEVLLT